MIAKLVVWGTDRSSALLKLRSCLSQFNVHGLSTNVNFLMNLSGHKAFADGLVDTDFIPRHHEELFPEGETSDERLVQAVMALVMHESSDQKSRNHDRNDPFGNGQGLRVNHSLVKKVELESQNGEKLTAKVIYEGDDNFAILVGAKTYRVRGDLVSTDDPLPELCCDINGRTERLRVFVNTDSGAVCLFTADGAVSFKRQLPAFLSSKGGPSGGSVGAGDALAPMPGTVEQVKVSAGQSVKKGEPVAVMIAMKMEYVIKAPKDGVVDKVPHKVGDFVKKGTPLVVLKD